MAAAAAPAARTAVAVVEAPAPAAGPADELEARVIGEIRAALRGATPADLCGVLGADPSRVEAALAALAARGALAKRGTRWFMA
jgi:hypothetical protein